MPISQDANGNFQQVFPDGSRGPTIPREAGISMGLAPEDHDSLDAMLNGADQPPPLFQQNEEVPPPPAPAPPQVDAVSGASAPVAPAPVPTAHPLPVPQLGTAGGPIADPTQPAGTPTSPQVEQPAFLGQQQQQPSPPPQDPQEVAQASEGPSPSMTGGPRELMDQGIANETRGGVRQIAAERDVEKKQLEGQDQAEAMRSEALDEEHQKIETHFAEAEARTKRAFDRLDQVFNTDVDPGRFWKSRTGFQKAALLVSAAIGGALSVATKSGRNPALELIEAQIERDIRAQSIDRQTKLAATAQDQGLITSDIDRAQKEIIMDGLNTVARWESIRRLGRIQGAKQTLDERSQARVEQLVGAAQQKVVEKRLDVEAQLQQQRMRSLQIAGQRQQMAHARAANAQAASEAEQVDPELRINTPDNKIVASASTKQNADAANEELANYYSLHEDITDIRRRARKCDPKWTPTNGTALSTSCQTKLNTAYNKLIISYARSMGGPVTKSDIEAAKLVYPEHKLFGANAEDGWNVMLDKADSRIKMRLWQRYGVRNYDPTQEAWARTNRQDQLEAENAAKSPSWVDEISSPISIDGGIDVAKTGLAKARKKFAKYKEWILDGADENSKFSLTNPPPAIVAQRIRAQGEALKKAGKERDSRLFLNLAKDYEKAAADLERKRKFQKEERNRKNAAPPAKLSPTTTRKFESVLKTKTPTEAEDRAAAERFLRNGSK